LVFFDAIRVKIRDEGFVCNKAVCIALGILPEGTKEILGIWIEQTEGARPSPSFCPASGALKMLMLVWQRWKRSRKAHWGRKYPAIGQSWRRHWEQVIPFLRLQRADPPDHLYQSAMGPTQRALVKPVRRLSISRA
jgi:transposase-like protein